MAKVDSRTLTESQRDDFLAGWKDTGGYMGDADTNCPWCCPWHYSADIEVFDDDYYYAGAAYWEEMKPEVAMRLKAETEIALETLKQDVQEELETYDLDTHLKDYGSAKWAGDQKAAFVAGWKAAGGYVSDAGTDGQPQPWAPWTYGVTPEVVDGDYFAAGAKFSRAFGEKEGLPYLAVAENKKLKRSLKATIDKIEEIIEAQSL